MKPTNQKKQTSAAARIRAMLTEIMSEEEAAGLYIWKGYSMTTNCDGWHFRRFGETGSETHMGNSVQEVEYWIDQVLTERQQGL